MNSGDTLVVTGTASLYVSGNFKMNSGLIYIAPGGSLSLYVAGGTATFSGGGVLNNTGLAANFSYYGLPGNTSIKYAGSSAYIGTINAPEADMTLTGGANFYGAVIVNSFNSKSAGAGLHYDEALSGTSMLKVLAYREL